MGKRITIENAELTATFNGTAYVFPWVNSITIADSRENVLAGSPQGTGDGITYRTGTTAPITADFIVREISTALFNLLKGAFADQERVDFLLFDKISGDQYTLNNAIVRSNPSNITVAEGEGTFDITVNTSCSSSNFEHKAAAD